MSADISVTEVDAQQVGVVNSLYERPFIRLNGRWFWKIPRLRYPVGSPAVYGAPVDPDSASYLKVRNARAKQLSNGITLLLREHGWHEQMFAHGSVAI